MDSALDGIRSAIEESVARLVRGKTGVMFSGGLDSAVIAFLANRACDARGYVIGTMGAQDLEWAGKVAADMGLELREKVLGEKDVWDAYDEVKELLGTDDLLSIELGIPVLLCSRMAKEDGVGTLLCGHGADELFGGYHRYPEMFRRGEDVRGMMDRDLRKVLETDVPRGRSIARREGVELAFPFLGERVIGSLGGIKAEKHFSTEERKPVLRAIARRLGIPEDACSRPKKAVQYGSGVHRILTLRRPNNMGNL